MKLKENIKSLRDEMDMTLEELGKKIGVSKQTIQRYETGEISNVPYDKIEDLARTFEVSPGYLMGWDKDRVKIYDSETLSLEHKVKYDLKKEEMELILAYRKADDIDRATVRRTLGLEKRDYGTSQKSKISRKDA